MGQCMSGVVPGQPVNTSGRAVQPAAPSGSSLGTVERAMDSGVCSFAFGGGRDVKQVQSVNYCYQQTDSNGYPVSGFEDFNHDDRLLICEACARICHEGNPKHIHTLNPTREGPADKKFEFACQCGRRVLYGLPPCQAMENAKAYQIAAQAVGDAERAARAAAGRGVGKNGKSAPPDDVEGGSIRASSINELPYDETCYTVKDNYDGTKTYTLMNARSRAKTAAGLASGLYMRK